MKANALLASLTLFLGSLAAAAPFTVSANGQEVTDTKTGLIWRRCAEGMVFNSGTCAGTATLFVHEQALQRARSQSDGGWRLPNVKELASLVDRSVRDPSIDLTAFPATQSNNFWSSSPYVGNSGYAWYVNFFVGDVRVLDRSYYQYPVRLVRAGQ